MKFFIQLLVSGAAVGSIYGLAAVGYSITFTALRVFNFGQGQFVMLGAMIGLTLHVTLGLNLILSIIGTIILLALVTVVMERICVRPFGPESMAWAMSTLGFAIIVENAAQLIWGRDAMPFPAVFGENPIRVLGIGVYPQELLVLAVSIMLMVALEVFYRGTIAGKALRATAYDRDVASLMGINVSAMATLIFTMSSSLAAIAGILVAPITLTEATMGGMLGLKAFAVAIIGGLDSPRGIFVAAIGYGIFEALCAGYIYTGIRDILGFGLVIVVLLVRPAGLFGRAATEKV